MQRDQGAEAKPMILKPIMQNGLRQALWSQARMFKPLPPMHLLFYGYICIYDFVAVAACKHFFPHPQETSYRMFPHKIPWVLLQDC